MRCILIVDLPLAMQPCIFAKDSLDESWVPPELEIWLFRSSFACSYSHPAQASAYSKCDGVKGCVRCTCVCMHYETSVRRLNDALRPAHNSVTLVRRMTAKAHMLDQLHADTRDLRQNLLAA